MHQIDAAVGRRMVYAADTPTEQVVHPLQILHGGSRDRRILRELVLFEPRAAQDLEVLADLDLIGEIDRSVSCLTVSELIGRRRERNAARPATDRGSGSLLCSW